jgi:hypothetical protein
MGCTTVKIVGHTRPDGAARLRGSGLPKAVNSSAIQWVINGTHNIPTRSPGSTAKNAGSEFMGSNY